MQVFSIIVPGFCDCNDLSLRFTICLAVALTCLLSMSVDKSKGTRSLCFDKRVPEAMIMDAFR